MSTLTKVFLVLVAVFAVALATLTIAANALSQSWKKAADHWKAAGLAAQASERAVTVQAALTHEQDLDRIRRLSDEVEQLRTGRTALQAQLDARTLELAQARNQLATLMTDVTGLGDTLRLVTAQFQREQEHARKLVARNAELERRNIDLNDRTKELTTGLAMATTQVRALQQQISAMEEERPRADAGLRPALQVPGPGVVEADQPRVQPQIAAITAPIRGEILEVRGNIASISVGTADGVSPGMKFLVFRPSSGEQGPEYLGTLQITRTEANRSAGTLLRVSGDIRRGDRATDEASFAMRR